MPPVIDKSKCDGCGICADICPTDVFFGTKKGEIPVMPYEEECWHCNACVLDCKKEAMSLRLVLPATMLYIEKT